MHQLIASYLFQNKTCPLPGLGHLSLFDSAAVPNFSEKIIIAPAPVISFEPGDAHSGNLLNYIASTTNSNNYEAAEALDHFCENLKVEILEHTTANLNGIGNFFVDLNGDIKFKSETLPSVFLQPVPAERVIHPQAEHSILVGDKETTNTLMTEYFSEETIVKDRWWIWAIILGVIGTAILLFYFNDADGSSQFGNAIKL